MNITDLYASIKNQARRAVYDERDDSAHFEQFHWVKDEAIRRRILVERAIVRRAVRDILAADFGDFCITVQDTDTTLSRNLDEIMGDVGQRDEETIIVRRRKLNGGTGPMVGRIFLVHGNDGWDVIADHTDSPLMHELLQEANRLANVLGALIAASPAIPSSTNIQAGALVRIKMDLTDSDEDGQDRITPAGSIGLLTEGYDESNWNVVFANGATQVFSNEELGRASECEFVPSDSPEGIAARAAIDAASDEASQETMTAPVQAAGAGTPPGELLRRFREYLTVHPGIELGGHDMDNMALDLTRIALTALQEEPAAQAEAQRQPTAWKDHQTAQLVNELRDCAAQFGQTQQLRERIATIVAPLCSQLKDALGLQDDGRRSDAEIVERTEAAARFLLEWKYGLVPEVVDAQLRHSKNTKAQWAWDAACKLQEIITDTDAINAAQEVDDEEPESPATRTVTISACEAHEGVESVTLTLPWRCIHCGGPRGEPAIGTSWDGSRQLAVHTWTNPCGHVEKYSQLREWAAVNGEG